MHSMYMAPATIGLYKHRALTTEPTWLEAEIHAEVTEYY